MTIRTVRNVEYGKCFVLIGCGPVSPNESKVMAVWRNGRKRRTARWSDSTVLAKVFDLLETPEHAHTVALDIKDIMIAEGINEDMGQKLFYWRYSAINVLFLRPFCLPHFLYLIVLHIFINTRGLFTNITTSRQSDFEENVKRIWYLRIWNGIGCFTWLLSL